MPMEIDPANLRELAAIITEVCSTMRKAVLEDKYSSEEKLERAESLIQIKTAAEWTLRYIDYYTALVEISNDPEIIGEYARLTEILQPSDDDSEYFSGGKQLVKQVRKQYDQDESAGE